jgi:hypothetical protein
MRYSNFTHKIPNYDTSSLGNPVLYIWYLKTIDIVFECLPVQVDELFNLTATYG